MQLSNGRHVAHRNLLQGNWIGCPRHINSLFADYICVDGNFVCDFCGAIALICCTVSTGLADRGYCHMLQVCTIEPRKRGHYILYGEGGRTEL